MTTTAVVPLTSVEITQGSYLVKHDAEATLFGCPSEVLKFIARKSEQMPATIVLPDTAERHGVSQWAIEFPLYHFLFVQKGVFQGKKLRVVGTADQCRRARDLMRITLLGPTKAEYRRWNVPKRVHDILRAEAEMLALKEGARPDGRILEIDDMVDFVVYDADGRVILPSGVVIVKVKDSKNLFVVTDTQGQTVAVDCNFVERQRPPYDIASAPQVECPCRLAVRVLGYSSGFDPYHPCTGLGLWVNGVYLLWDAPPYLRDHLEARGISLEQVGGVFLSHVHDDHCSILELIHARSRVRVITTREIFESMLVKLGAILGKSPDAVRKSIDFVEVTVGKPLHLYGATMHCFYTIHPIPTIGMRVELGTNGESKVLFLSSDMLGPSDVVRLHEAGKISDRRFAEVQGFIRGDETYAFYDGGGNGKPGEIHPDPRDAWFRQLASMGQRLVFGHRGSMPAEVANEFGYAEPGKFFEILPGVVHDHTDGLHVAEALEPLGAKDGFWTAALLQAGKCHHVPQGEVVVRQHTRADAFYIVLAGALDVVVEVEGKPVTVARLEKGDFFGEVAILQGTPRTATVRTVGPTRLFEVSATIFEEFVHALSLQPRLELLWERRRGIAHAEIFKDIQPRAMAALAERVQSQDFIPRQQVVAQGSQDDGFYIVVAGSVEVYRETGGRDEHLATLVAGQFFGEALALGVVPERTASVRALEPARLYRLTGEELRTLANEFPVIRHRLGLVLRERGLPSGDSTRVRRRS